MGGICLRASSRQSPGAAAAGWRNASAIAARTGALASGSLHKKPDEFFLSTYNFAGSGMRGLRRGVSLANCMTGSAISVSSGASSSARRLTKDVLAPFSSSRRTEIGEQIFVAADRRIDARAGARHRRFLDLAIQFVEGLAHPVQALIFEIPRPSDEDLYGRQRVSVVSGELREEASRRRNDAGAGDIGRISGRLAGEHGIIGKSRLLAALNFGIPISTLHEAHGNRNTPTGARSPSQSNYGKARF